MNLKDSLTARAKALPLEALAAVLVAFADLSLLVLEMGRNIHPESKLELLGRGNLFFLPNMTGIWLNNRTWATRGERRCWL